MQIGFFDIENKENRLSELGDHLEKLNSVIDWEMFRPILKKAFQKEHKGPGGRPPFDYVMMFKILIIQKYYNLSDEQAEFQINDRISFMRFLGLGLADKVPDAKTIWYFRNVLTEKHTAEQLFNCFEQTLEDKNLISHKGSIIDATFSEVPKQHNTPDEKKALKEGKVPEEWKKPENKHKLSQKDTDAKYTQKRAEFFYGYKNHIKVDADSKLITKYCVTPANTADFQMVEYLIDEKDKELWADSGYCLKPVFSILPSHIKTHILEKNTKCHPLTDEQRKNNTEKSKVRVRVEHVFGHIKNTMNGTNLRSIGIKRVSFDVMLLNLTYNMCRFEFLSRSLA